MKFVSLFSGIGGLDLGLERAGHEGVLQVEIDPFCRAVLEKHWPNVRKIKDIHDVTVDDCNGADMLVGGFPCQPVANVGSRKVDRDGRWLWPEFFRLIREGLPAYVLIENVPGLRFRGGDRVLSDLASCGYDAEWTSITAKAVGSPHNRERLFILAYPSGGRRIFGESFDEVRVSEEWGISPEKVKKWEDWRSWLSSTLDAGYWEEPGAEVLGVDDGVPSRLDKDRIKACGNAVVPQVAEYVGRLLPLESTVDSLFEQHVGQ